MSNEESSENVIPEEEKKVINTFEKIIGDKIPELNDIQYHNVGFLVQEGHVISLGLFSCNLTTIPDLIESLQHILTFSSRTF